MENASRLCKHCSETAKMLVCYQHSFSHKTKIQHHTGAIKEINSPRQTQCSNLEENSTDIQGHGLVVQIEVNF